MPGSAWAIRCNLETTKPFGHAANAYRQCIGSMCIVHFIPAAFAAMASRHGVPCGAEVAQVGAKNY